MATIEKKIWPEFFDQVASGKKKFDLRLNEFAAQPGDTLLLKEWDPATKQYTGREMTKKITFVYDADIDRMFWPKEEVLQKGLKILSIE